jgi:hypothetical protein
VKDPVCDYAVELLASEGKGFRRAHERFDAAFARELDHSRREVERNHVRPQLLQHPLGEGSRAAANLEHAARPDLGECLERQLLRVLALDVVDERDPSSQEALLARVLAGHGGRIVEPHGSRRGAPGIPRDGAFPPSQALTVAPTSANSPSCTAPAAFLPST